MASRTVTSLALSCGGTAAEPLTGLRFIPSPDGSGPHIGMPHGTVLLMLDFERSAVTVIADISPNARDWTEACMVLAGLHAGPLGDVEFQDEHDMWVVSADLAHCDYPLLAAEARAYLAA